MKLSVLIPSRGKAISLLSVIGALDALSSGQNEIKYCVGLDEDDVDSCVTVQNIQAAYNISISIAPRAVGLGAIYNRLAKANPADAYVLFADDIFPITIAWDKAISICHENEPNSIVAWYDAAQPLLPTYPIIPHSWYERVGAIFTEHFPFWFDDTWLVEVYKMATGKDVLIPQQLIFAGKKGRTHRMRDLEFWWNFFNRTRPYRIEQARGLKDENVDFDATSRLVLEEGIKRDNYLQPRLSDLERSGEEGEPDESYLAAKSAAEKFLVEHRL